jgi:hypothetical protein
MHDNDGVEAFVCFTSIPCGHDPQLSIGHFGTIAYIYKAIKSCQQDRDPASQNRSSRPPVMHSPHTSIVSYPSPYDSRSLVLHPALSVVSGKASTVQFPSLSCPPVQLNLSPFLLLNGSAASYFPFAAISSCAWDTGAGSAPPSWLGLGRSWKLEVWAERAGRCA